MVNNNWTAFLMHYSLAELRRRQRILQEQLKQIDIRTSETVLQRMQDMDDSLTETIATKYCCD